MWMVTTRGFYSVVSAGFGQVQIRARAKADLEAILDILPPMSRHIRETPAADYRFRVITTPRGWRRCAAALANEATQYANFKAATKKTHPERAAMYLDVWNALQGIDDRRRLGPLEEERLDDGFDNDWDLEKLREESEAAAIGESADRARRGRHHDRGGRAAPQRRRR